MDTDSIDAFDLEPSAFQLVDEPPKGRGRVGAGEDVLVQAQAPDQILVLPGFPQPSDLQEEHPVVVEHVKDLRQEGVEVADAHVLGHLETGDFLVSFRRQRNIPVVHT